MTEKVFQWNSTGPSVQEFTLGVVNNENKSQMESMTFVVENLTPGIPYSLNANVLNIRTNQHTIFDTFSDTVWIESNIDSLAFTKDHAKSFVIDATDHANQIVVHIAHSLNHLDVRTLFETYRFKFDIFAESTTDTQCFQTYDITIAENAESFPLPDLVSNVEYGIYYSLLVNPGEQDDSWYHVTVHKYVGTISFTESTEDRCVQITDDRIRQAFNDLH